MNIKIIQVDPFKDLNISYLYNEKIFFLNQSCFSFARKRWEKILSKV